MPFIAIPLSEPEITFCEFLSKHEGYPNVPPNTHLLHVLISSSHNQSFVGRTSLYAKIVQPFGIFTHRGVWQLVSTLSPDQSIVIILPVFLVHNVFTRSSIGVNLISSQTIPTNNKILIINFKIDLMANTWRNKFRHIIHIFCCNASFYSYSIYT